MESTSEKLEHLENLMGIMIEDMKRLQQKEIKFPEMTDYTPLIEEINKQVTISNNLLTAIDRQKNMQRELIEGIPKKVRTRVEHRVTDKTRPYLIAFFIMVAVTGISFAVAISLGIRNTELHDNSIKFRMLRQVMPEITIGIDTIYAANAEKAERHVQELESQQLALLRAEQLVEQRKNEAEDAKGEVKKLKGKKKK